MVISLLRGGLEPGDSNAGKLVTLHLVNKSVQSLALPLPLRRFKDSHGLGGSLRGPGTHPGLGGGGEL